MRAPFGMAALSHPHIVTVYDVGSHNNYHYLAMEYHTGGDLSSRIANGGLTPYESLRITRQLADALGLKVQLADRGGKGELTVSYGTLEQLDDLCRRLMRG